MLYGMEEFEDEFGLVKKEKLNITKVVIVVACFLVLFIIVFSVIMANKNKKNNDQLQAVVDNKEEQTEINDNSEQENLTPTTENEESQENYEDDGKYFGPEMQIPVHDDLKFVPVLNENAQSLIKDIYYSDEKQVYLTFDDGPSKDITPQILDILKENDVKATFFVLGARVELYPDNLKREYNEGHYIANHGYSHEYSRIYESKDTVFQEYIDCENAIKNALGNQDYNSYLFRFPGGSSGGRYNQVKIEAKELFKNYGIAHTNWNCLTGDAAGNKTREACLEEMYKTKENQNSIILLMHDANDKSQTVEALPEIIQYYKNEGYTFKTFYEIFK